MGISSKSHSKKSDKETQSPVLKLFRDMIQKEKHDPEKTNLLKSKGEKKKKKHSGSRSKSNKSIASGSCSEHQVPYKGNQSLLNAQFDPIRIQSNDSPFQGEKRESWWFWGDTAEKPVSDDTCSCVSCALKKLINTDYACIACLILLFTVSVLVAFLLVYNSVPCLSEKLGKLAGSGKTETDRPKRKIEGLSRLRWDELDSVGVGVPESLDETNIQDLASLVKSNSQLGKMLDNDLMNEIQNSEKLREFYKKLIKTDAQIRNLKKNNEINANNMESIDKYRMNPERAKRSLKIFHRPLKLFHFKKKKHVRGHKLHENDKTNNNNKNVEENGKFIVEAKESNQKPKTRNKRFDNTSEPEGFLIENKKFMIRYKPSRKSKCSHAPKESKSHETQLKHPFYQNTQRLDELLDRFLGKNLPELLDPFGLDLAIDKEKKCKHPKLKVDTEVTVPDNVIENDKTITKVDEKFINLKEFNKDKVNTKMVKAETNTVHDLLAELEASDGIKRETATNTYGLLMSVSTVIYPENNLKKTSYFPMLDRVPNARKLLQTDADDDMNEVIVDTHDSVDANDDPDDRKKRMGDSNMALPSDNSKRNPANIINPNWKGPMPLYPDELNSMVKQDTRINRVETSVHNSYTELNEEPVINSEGKYDDNQNLVENPLNKDTISETDESDADLNDMDYIEDYFRNKYDRLVEMAQAYSDYGVLEGKKSTDKADDKAKTEVSDHRIKLSLGGLKEGFKNSIFGRSKKGSNQDPSVGQNTPASEGFRLEFHPTSETREDNPTDFLKSVQKHLKFSNPKANQYDTIHNVPELELMYTPKVEAKSTKKCERGVLFSLGGKRTLKSVDIEEPESDESEPITDITVRNIDEIETDTTVDVDEITRNEFENVHLRLKREVDSNVLTKDVTIKPKLDTEVQTKTYVTSLSDIDEDILHHSNDSEVLKHEVSNNSLSTAKLPIDEFVEDKDVKTSKLNLTDESSYKTDNMSLSNFFMLLSNWFSALDDVDTSATNKTKEVTNSSEINYPIYDSDMIENIGHRSRVLLSVEDINATAKVKSEAVGITEKPVNITKDLLKTTNINKTKSIVKRDIDDSNLIFWNDIYDDEYGVMDNLENVREKYSVKSDTKKTNDWFRDKVRKIADGFYKKAEIFKADHIDVKKGKDKVAEDGAKIRQKSTLMRFSRNVDESGAKTDFVALTKNMKNICKKAAKDVALANKIDVRQVNKEGQVTSTLMQQLVRMMGDLVDYQVKQRTCRKLPPDLQNFLEWLTSGTDGEPDKDRPGLKTDDFSDMDFEKLSVTPRDDHTSDMIPMNRGEKSGSRDYLGTLKSVQALMKQYDDLSDDDKSKMTGVKEYLENQIQYLQKQINSGLDINLYNTDPVRFRRDVSKTMKDKPKRRRRFKQFFAKLMKKLGRKRNEKNEKPKDVNVKVISNDKASKATEVKDKLEKEKDSRKIEKRNLRDVYYKAVEDAKKLTTIKSK